MNGERCASSNCQTLQSCRLAATSPDMFTASELTQFSKLLTKTAFYRYGGDCYNYALLASGHIDFVVEADLQPYDKIMGQALKNAACVCQNFQVSFPAIEKTG